MPTITRLVAGKRNPEQVNLYLDDSFAFSLPLEIVIKRSLKVNSTLNEAQLNSLRQFSYESKLLTKILNFLSYRPRSKKEIVDRLKKYLYQQDNQDIIIQHILNKLQQLNYLDDLAFATWFVQSRVNLRPRSRSYLTRELLQKGIDREIIQQVVKQFANNSQALAKLISKKQSLGYQKLVAYLARRGFSYQEIKMAILHSSYKQVK